MGLISRVSSRTYRPFRNVKMSQNCSVTSLEPQSIPFSFFDLASGLLFRYPNPLAKHVQCYDVVSPFQINENGELIGKSLVIKIKHVFLWWKNTKPIWRRKLCNI